MSKTLKMSILFIIITLGILFLTQTGVNAAEIDSVDTLKKAFDGKEAIIDGTTITLTGDVEFICQDETEGSEEIQYDIVNLSEEDYVLNLNGHSLIAGEFYVCAGSSLIINDTTGKGTIKNYAMIEEGAKAVINNGTFSSLLDNSGELIINNATIHSIWNFGTLTINDGSFKNILQEGKATIKGGTFTAYKLVEKLEDGSTSECDYFSQFNIGAETIITGGEFKATDFDYVLSVMSNEDNVITEESIEKLIGEGYCAEYTKYSMDNWDVKYSSVKIIKDQSAEILEKAAPNGVWTINSAKPNSFEDADALLSAVAGDIKVPEGYELKAWCIGEEFDPEVGQLVVYTTSGKYLAEKNIKIVYKEPSSSAQTQVNSVLSKIDTYTEGKHSVEKGFRLEDLYLINYLNSSSKGIDASSALNFTKDLIKITNGANISYKYDSRLGSDSPNGLWNYTGGQVVVYIDGVATDTTKVGLTTNHVLYVPGDTANTDEAKITAALKRIEDYLGTTKGITIKVGGTFESLNNNEDDITWNEYGFIDEKTCGLNYYNVTINGKTYKFAICKKDENKLETPKYIGSNLESNISITSDDTTIPLDTSIIVKEVKNENTIKNIKKVVGRSEYVAYDISLYSNTKQANITKLENGKFKVSIPIPENLKDKELIVYHIKDSGEKEEYVPTTKDGITTFETNHFSTYVLAEKVKKDISPDTGNVDMIEYVVLVTIVSALGIVILKRKK